MHTLEFNFHTITNSVAVDALVYAQSIELFLKYRIPSSQPTDSTLVFETSTHCLLAQLILGSDTRFTIHKV